METVINKIYNKLIDDESKFLFSKKIEGLILKDGKIFLDAINELDREWEVAELEYVYKESEKPILIWGGGINGVSTFRLLDKIGLGDRVIAFVDSNPAKSGSIVCGKTVILPKEISSHSDAIIIIAAFWKTALQIFEQVMKMYDIPKENIIFPRQGHLVGITGNQYFDFFEANEGEVFVDAGASYGDTSGEFAKWAHNNYDGIFAFEPREGGLEFYNKSVEMFNLKNTKFIDKGTWSEPTVLCFQENGSASKIIANSECKVEVTTIDNVLNGQKATFIKMDVEGSELQSLMGAKNTIQMYRPRMAISLYHKPTDILDIPRYILELDDSYSFAIRQYHFDGSETVLYAF